MHDTRDEVVFYRECPNLSPADLPQMGPQGWAAYQEALADYSRYPHARMDVKWQAPAPE